MTLRLNFPQQSSWLLWLLVLAPTCLLPLLGGERSDHQIVAATLARAGIVAVALALVNGVGLAGIWPWSESLAKEFRLQLPASVLAIFVPAVLGSFPHGFFSTLAIAAFWLGSAALSASSFGAEFEHRTMGALLAQPRSRWKILAEKFVVLAVLLLLASGQMMLALMSMSSAHLDLLQSPQNLATVMFEFALVPLLVFCTGPLLALLTRRTLAAAVLVATLPFALLLLGFNVCAAIFKLRHPEMAWPENPPGFLMAIAIGTPIYLLAGFLGGCWKFHRVEWRESAAAPAPAGVQPLAKPLDTLLRALLPAGPTASLVRKELRLHVAAWLPALLMAGLWLLWLGARRLGVETSIGDGDLFTAAACLFGGLIALLTGAATVAEEREMGTLDWQFTQPASLRRQWWIKIGSAFGVAMLLGVALPAGLLRLSIDFASASKSVPLVSYWILPVIGLGLFLSGVYASSLCRNTVNAVVLALLMGVGIAITSGVPAQWLLWATQQHGVQMENLWPGWCALVLWLAMVATVTLYMSWGNLRRNALTSGQILRQFLGVGASVILITVIAVGMLVFLTVASELLQHVHSTDPVALIAE